MSEKYDETKAEMSFFQPFITIWLTPRNTVREMMTNQGLLFSAIIVIATLFLGGITWAMPSFNLLNDFYGVTAFGYVVSASSFVFIGLIFWVMNSGILLLLGKLFQGVSTFKEMLIATGVAYIPMLISRIIMLLQVQFIDTTFTVPSAGIPVIQILATLIFFTIQLILFVWSIIIFLQVVSEVHCISVWLALLITLLPAIILGLALIIIMVILLLIASQFIT